MELITPFHSRLRVRHVTDRQTDRRRPSMHNAPNLWEWGGINRGNVLRHIVYSGFLFGPRCTFTVRSKTGLLHEVRKFNEKQNTKTIIDERDKSGNYSTFYRRELASFLAHVALT